MSSDNAKWLDEANEKFESCAYACCNGSAARCGLGGYPVLDCPSCKSYKKCSKKKEGE